MEDTALVSRGLSKLPQILNLFGYAGLRKGQDRVVLSLLAGKDVIAILPTGAGKTSCFVIPALCHEWPLLVISPLQALMRDQCHNLWKAEVPAGRLSGDQSEGENDSVLKGWCAGRLNIMFIAPERLQNEGFKEAMRQRQPKMVAIDEAHSISEWSDNFRPDYAKIGGFINNLNDKVECVAAFTATLPPTAENDVRRVLNIPNAKRVKHYPRRKNLLLGSSHLTSHWDLLDKVNEVKGSCIVYCATRRNVEETAEWLSKREGLEGLVAPYHAGFPRDLRRQYQDDFMNNGVRVICATNAFGMGIDKPDIRGVIHYDMPGSIEALVQEIGRGGRDDRDTICHTFFRTKSKETQDFLLNMSNPPSGTVRMVFNAVVKAAGSIGGEVRMSNYEIAQSCRVDGSQVSASLSYLKACGVIERYKQKELIAYALFPDEESDEGRERRDRAHQVSNLYEIYESTIRRIGIEQHTGHVKFDVQLLADQLSVQEPTVRNNLYKWKKMDLLAFIPPYSGTVTKLLGMETEVDWNRIDQKRKENCQRLEDVMDYFQQPDSEKHEFLEEYFKRPA